MSQSHQSMEAPGEKMPLTASSKTRRQFLQYTAAGAVAATGVSAFDSVLTASPAAATAGALYTPISVSGTTTLPSSESIYAHVHTSGTAYTITLPAAVASGDVISTELVTNNNDIVSIAPASGDSVAGVSGLKLGLLNPGEVFVLVDAESRNWHVQSQPLVLGQIGFLVPRRGTLTG
jgi:hypothetical protein